MSLVDVGPLKCLHTDTGAETCIVFFHGYGANAYDLAPLAHEIQIKKPVDFYFPEAPLQLNMGGYMAGRAWFPIDEKALEEAMMRGGFRDYASIRPPGIDKAVQLSVGFLEVLTTKYKTVFLGGFSQGAMLTTDLVLQQKINPKALIILSGTLINKKRWLENMAQVKNLDIFQSHGENDQVLDYRAAEQLSEFFVEKDYNVEFHGFRGGHEIPRQVLKRLEQFINYRI